MNTVEQVVILSAELSKLSSVENDRRTVLLNDMITELRLPFKSAKGVYKGSAENSFVVIVREQADIDTLTGFAFKAFGQESVLHQDANQLAQLIYANGKTETLGKLVQVPKELAETLDNYTIMEGKFYTTTPI
jgi:hypothetical protein